MMRTDCLKMIAWLSARRAPDPGRLPAPLKNHAAHCQSCRNRLRAETVAGQALTSLADDGRVRSEGQHQRLMKALRERHAADVKPRSTVAQAWMPLAALGGVVALAVALVLFSEPAVQRAPGSTARAPDAAQASVALADIRRQLAGLDTPAIAVPEAALRAELDRLKSDLRKLGLERPAKPDSARS